jgi:hypothetical protein
MAGDDEGRGRLERAIDVLREVDAKGMFAVVSIFAAEVDLEKGRPEVARARADAALAAALAVERRSQAALARTILGRVALLSGDATAARREVLATLRDYVRPLGLSARARAAVSSLAASLGVDVPTLDTTAASTDAAQTPARDRNDGAAP